MRNALTQRRATSLRKKPTDSENHLWYFLRRRHIGGLRFRRQYPIGPYVADFVCLEVNLVVEVDGSQHSNSNHDRIRDDYLKRSGFKVLRFWNHDVLMQTDAVLDEILQTVRMPPS